jgi:hypothetical protein
MKKRFILKIILRLNAVLQCTSLATHRSIGFFHCSKQSWKSSLVRAFKSSADFRFTSSFNLNRVPFKADLIFGKRKKSQCAKSAKYGACSST